MAEQSKEELMWQRDIVRSEKEQREVSNQSYADKLVEKVVWGILAAIALTLIAYAINALIISAPHVQPNDIPAFPVK